MILIIDNYRTPAYRIRDSIYKGKDLIPFSSDAPVDSLCFIHSECVSDLDHFRYLAQEIVEVSGDRIFVLNKKKRTVTFYKQIDKRFVREDKTVKSSFKSPPKERLPFLMAQEDEIVFFPSEEEE